MILKAPTVRAEVDIDPLSIGGRRGSGGTTKFVDPFEVAFTKIVAQTEKTLILVWSKPVIYGPSSDFRSG
jgi:hypothetical protein